MVLRPLAIGVADSRASHGLPLGSCAFDQPHESQKRLRFLDANRVAKKKATTSKVMSSGAYIKNV